MHTRVTLVLGAGGPVGHAFHVGVLRALYEHRAWDARDAALVLGTSAGAQVAALLRAGMSPRDLSARVTGEPMSDEAHAIARHWVRPQDAAQPAPKRPYAPASPEYLGHVARAPWRARPMRLVSALMPEGHVCLRPQIAGLRNVFGETWTDRPLWITAVDRSSGERITWGHPESPPLDVGTAVAASGAVPWLCQPVEAHGRKLIDGGMHSPTHLDLLEHEDHHTDLVLVLSPLSALGSMRLLLSRELARLRRAGQRVIAIEPDAAVRDAMGGRFLDPARAAPVAHAAYASIARALEVGHPLDEHLLVSGSRSSGVVVPR